MVDAQISACSELQLEELQVIESIYPECIIFSAVQGMKKLEISVELAGPEVTRVVSDEGGCATEETHNDPTTTLTLSCLPPVYVEFFLPPTYPLVQPPSILSLRMEHEWISDIAFLRRRLDEMFHQGEGVIYSWIEWIKGGDFLKEMGLVQGIDERFIRLSHAQPRLLSSRLRSHDDSVRSSRFSKGSYTCSICFSSRKGSRCQMLRCGHVFCQKCLEEGWRLYISEGDISRVGCPDPVCVKLGIESTEDEVRRVVLEDEVQRWKYLREKRLLEQDPGTVYCPQSLCHNAVPRPVDASEDGSGWGRLRTCSSCNYSFCSLCKRTWHGPLDDCPISNSESIILEYLGYEENSVERQKMEAKYGRHSLTRMISRYKEEKANQDWLENSTTECPQCEIRVEKSQGCNHMICVRCKTHFCYLCGQQLSVGNPYAHFSTPRYGCYMKLFDAKDVESGAEMEVWE